MSQLETLQWELSERCPELQPLLAPWVAEWARLERGRVPAPFSAKAYESPQAWRGRGSHRVHSIAGDGDGVLCVKGSEPIAPDLGEQLALAALGPSGDSFPLLNRLEQFVVQERKIPWALTLDEALTECEAAATAQLAHARAFGTLAALPVPLWVARFPDDVAERHFQGLGTLMSAECLEQARRDASRGLAVYVYWFPHRETRRVAHLGALLRQHGSAAARLELLRGLCDVDGAVKGWCDTVADLLAAGLSPCSTAQAVTGQCVDFNNAVLSGGFMDAGSIRPLSQLGSDGDVARAVALTLEELSETVYLFLSGTLAHRSHGGAWVDQHVFERVRVRHATRLLALGRPDDTVARLLAPLADRSLPLELLHALWR